MSENKVTSFNLQRDLYERLQEYVGRTGRSRSEVIREAAGNVLTKAESEDYEELFEEIEREADEDSYELLETSIPTELKDGKKQFVSPKKFQDKIDGESEKIDKLQREIEDLQNEKDDIILNGVASGDVDTNKLQKIREKVRAEEDKVDDIKDIMKAYKSQKDKAEKVSKERKELKARLIANRVHDKVLNHVKETLDDRYKEFVEWWGKYQKVRGKFNKYARQAGKKNISRTFYDVECKMKKDFPELDFAPDYHFRDMKYKDQPLSEFLPNDLPPAKCCGQV